MGSKIAAAVFIIIFVLFLLSVFAPMHSQKKFWIVILKIREGMDLAVYWFFNLCGIAAILLGICVIVKNLMEKLGL